MINMIYKGIFLLVLSIFLSWGVFRIFNLKKIKKEDLIKIGLIILGFLLVFYIRFIVYNNAVFASADESNYIDLLYRIAAGKFAVVSGPGYILLLNLIKGISGIDFISLVPLLAAIVSSVSLFVIYLIYKKETKKPPYALLSCIVLLLTTHFLWPIIEGRPQQIGMFLVLISSVLFYKYLRDKNYFLPFIALYAVTFIFHILSFFVLSGGILLVGYWQYLNKKTELKKLIYVLIFFFLFIFLFFADWFVYSNMNGAIIMLLANYPLCVLNLPYVAVIVFALIILTTVLMTNLFKKSNLPKCIEYLTKKPIFFFLLVLAIIFSIFVQYKLSAFVYSSLYLNSFYYFILFQLGNICFGAMFLFGMFSLIKEKKTENLFFKYSVALMVIGAALLVLSFFFPGGFDNGLIRVLNYWTLFAAPIAAIPIIKINKKRWKIFLSILMSIFIIISLVNTSKDPSLFNYEYYWDKADFSAMKWVCNQEGIFLIENSANDFQYLSKESLYGRLGSILEIKDNFTCKSIVIANYLNNSFDELPAYSEGDIRIYNLTDIGGNGANISNTENILSKFKDKIIMTQEKETDLDKTILNERCPQI